MMIGPRFKRAVILVHRWTGVAACVLMALWFASGITMLFVGYPKLLPAERLGGLPELPAQGCCVAPDALPGVADARKLVLTSIRGRPHYVLTTPSGVAAFDAASGRRAGAVDGAAALAAGRAFLPGAAARDAGTVREDRWTHGRALDAHRPLRVVEMDDAAATRLYVSSTTGQVLLDAPRAERAWNYVGAWLHWLYMLRDQPKDPVWSWTVIALSAVGTVSALAGALNGIWRWRFAGRYKSGAKTPFRDVAMRWHHVLGMVFGLVLLAWIFSGLMSMNPLGVFDARVNPDLAAYAGATPGARRPAVDPARALARLRAAGFGARELEWRVLAGEPYLLARDGADRTRLVLADGAGGARLLARWPEATLRAAGQRLLAAPVRGQDTVARYDAYYYKRQAQSMYGEDERRLPVLRLAFGDAGATWAYLDPYTGDVAASMDRAQRAGRWLFNLLHSWDLPPMLAAGPLREAVLVVLGAGGLLFSATAVAIGLRRVRLRWREARAARAARDALKRPPRRSSGTGAA